MRGFNLVPNEKKVVITGPCVVADLIDYLYDRYGKSAIDWVFVTEYDHWIKLNKYLNNLN